MDWILVASLILNIGLLIIGTGQAKVIKELERQKQKPVLMENNEELVASVREKLKTDGMIKTVKYLRVEKGMTMIAAKQLVDRVSE